MSDDLRRQLERIAAAVRFLPPAGVRFAGRTFHGEAVGRLEGLLYEHAYNRPFDGTLVSPSEAALDTWSGIWAEALSRRLVAAHARRGRWRTGRVSCAAGSLTLQPGFYVVFSEAEMETEDGPLVRIYLNVKLGRAPDLLSSLAGRLDRFQVPFRFKVTTLPWHFWRLDPAVLYFSRRHFPIVAELLRDVLAEVGDGLEPGVPLFTKALVPGLAVAEDPGSGESFGQSRCRLLARGLFEADRRGKSSLEARMRAVREAFHHHGLDLDRPHLNPGSRDDYVLP